MAIHYQVLGLHHACGGIPEPATRRYHNRDEEILITTILAALPAGMRARLGEATQPAG